MAFMTQILPSLSTLNDSSGADSFPTSAVATALVHYFSGTRTGFPDTVRKNTSNLAGNLSLAFPET